MWKGNRGLVASRAEGVVADGPSEVLGNLVLVHPSANSLPNPGLTGQSSSATSGEIRPAGLGRDLQLP